MESSAVSAIELIGVSARYGGAGGEGEASRTKDAPLMRANLAAAPGEIVAVLGPNGAGKSTLLRVLAGTLAPYEGEVRLFGEPMSAPSREAIARDVAFVAQTESVAFGFTVSDVVMMGRAPHQGGWMRASDRDRSVVLAAMKQCDVEHLAARAVSELSGGEQKRVAIARALSQDARVLLLDEPAAFLDVRHQVDLYELLVGEVARRKRACVCVMHDLNAAAMYASRVVLMKGGAIVAAGPVNDVMTYARLKETFDADLYVGVNELTKDRFFLPMRRRPQT